MLNSIQGVQGGRWAYFCINAGHQRLVLFAEQSNRPPKDIQCAIIEDLPPYKEGSKMYLVLQISGRPAVHKHFCETTLAWEGGRRSETQWKYNNNTFFK